MTGAVPCLSGRVVGERRVRAELLEPALQFGQVRSESTRQPTADEVAGLELGDRRADRGHAADDLVAGHARVDGRHHVVPLVAHVCRSEWQMPQNRMSICTSGRSGSRRGMVVPASGGGRAGGGVGSGPRHECSPFKPAGESASMRLLFPFQPHGQTSPNRPPRPGPPGRRSARVGCSGRWSRRSRRRATSVSACQSKRWPAQMVPGFAASTGN